MRVRKTGKNIIIHSWNVMKHNKHHVFQMSRNSEVSAGFLQGLCFGPCCLRCRKKSLHGPSLAPARRAHPTWTSSEYKIRRAVMPSSENRLANEIWTVIHRFSIHASSNQILKKNRTRSQIMAITSSQTKSVILWWKPDFDPSRSFGSRFGNLSIQWHDMTSKWSQLCQYSRANLYDLYHISYISLCRRNGLTVTRFRFGPKGAWCM